MATNCNQITGNPITITFATTSPAAPGTPVIKCAAKATGGFAGVALNGTGTAAESIQVAREGVYTVPITAGGAMAVGDYVFASVNGDVAVSTTVLSETNTGLIFGILLDTIAGAGATTARVELVRASHL
jgi:predicted RecA/RadA family phage recombinase